jgi:hypothetical protein
MTPNTGSSGSPSARGCGGHLAEKQFSELIVSPSPAAGEPNRWAGYRNLSSATTNTYNPKERNIEMSEPDRRVFVATVQKEGSFTFVAIPFSPREVWGPRPRYPVSGTINDIPVRGTLGALGQDYFLRLAAAWIRDSRIEPGAKVTVKLSLEE